jgi:hypothetical protein
VGQPYFSAVEDWLYPGEHAVTMISPRPLCPAGDAAAVSGAGDCANAGDGAAGAAVINNANLGVEITRMIIPSIYEYNDITNGYALSGTSLRYYVYYSYRRYFSYA